jgi:hypothetical protein
MTVHLPFLLIAVVILWFPRQWLRLGFVFNKRRRSGDNVRAASEPWNTREPGDPRVRFVVEFSKFRNYVDLLRAGTGSIALAGGFGISPVFTLQEGAPRTALWTVIGLRSFILLVGLLVQTVRYEKRKFTFYPPIFFIAGLSLGLCQLNAEVAAFTLIWAVHIMFSGPQGFLMVYAVFIVGFGHLFSRQGDLSVILAGLLCFLPTLLSLLANRPLVIFSRKSTHAQR